MNQPQAATGATPASQADQFLQRADQVRRDLLELMDQTAARCREFELPDPAEQWKPLYEKLQQNQFQVLVMGEVKRGKTSLVNALIGRRVLPTDVDVATCQVFRITSGPRLQCRVVYEDDSRREIPPEELAKYGSQSFQDQLEQSGGDLPARGDLIRWIEVEVPLRFLPPNVSLLDTPGLGALYHSHAMITYRYVPQADGVIFVLDSEKPILAEELDALADVLEVTRNILFVQTKIDRHDRKDWEEQLRRHQEKLRERFGDKLGQEVAIWPLSSCNLFKGLDLDSEAVLQVSGFPRFAPALRKFLYRVAGWSQSVAAWVVVDDVHQQGVQFLQRRREHLLEESDAKIKQILEEIKNRAHEFDRSWRKKHSELVQEANKRKQLTLGSIQQSFSREVVNPIQKRINAIQNMKELEEYIGKDSQQQEEQADQKNQIHVGSPLYQDILAYLGYHVQQQLEKYRNGLMEESEKAFSDLEHLLNFNAAFPVEVTREHEAPEINIKPIKQGFLDKLARAKFHGGVVGSVVGYASVGLALLGAPVSVPLLFGAPLAAGVVASIVSFFKQGKKELQMAKERCKVEVEKIARQKLSEMLTPNPQTGHPGDIQQAIEQTCRQFLEAVENFIKSKKQDFEREIKILQEQRNATLQQRQQKLEQLKRQLQVWQGLQKRHAELGRELEKLQAALA